MTIEFSNFETATSAHYHLLLAADPEQSVVDSYLSRSICFQAKEKGELAGVILLLPTRPDTLEIINLAVADNFQGKGIAQQMIAFALEFARNERIQTVEIGTGSTSFAQLYLYQKCGFRITGVEPDFFVRHYSEEIVENRLVLRDMLRLAQHLSLIQQDEKG